MKITFSLLFSIILTNLFAQNITITGYAIDAETSETLIGASIFQQGTLQGVATNKFGHFVLKSHTDSAHISCSYVGYQSISITIFQDTTITFQLTKGKSLDEVTITANEKLHRLKSLSQAYIPTKDLKVIPSLTGEANILKAYQLMPGIQSGKEGYSGLLVRGGSPDQNLFLLDDLPLYNVVHFGGFYSTFDPCMVKDLTLYKGDFPARYGGRVSSVVDVRNIDGNLNEKHGEFVFSLLLSKIFLEGPIKKNKSSYAISLRRSNLDLITTPFNYITNNTTNAGFYFYDFNAKANLILSPNDRLFLNVYHGYDAIFDNIPKQKNDNIENKSKYKIKWGNTGISTRWYHVFDKHIFCNTTLAYSGYKYLNNANEKQKYTEENSEYRNKYKFKTGINDFMLKSDFEIPLAGQSLRTGAAISYKRFIPYSYELSESSDTEDNNKHKKEIIQSNDLSLYSEYKIVFSSFNINAGLHYNHYSAQGSSFHSLQPRITTALKLSSRLSAKASYTHMQQNMHLLSSSSPGLPNDLWLPATKYAQPLRSKQSSIGLYYQLNDNYEIGTEAYYKKLSKLIEYKEGALLFTPKSDIKDNIANNGNGKSKGIELLFRKTSGRSTGWIGYTLSKSDRQFEDLNKGKTFPFTYDRRHDLSIVYSYHLNKRTTLSGTWIYQTGHATTLSQGKYEIPNFDYTPNTYEDETYEIHIYSGRNSYRMPNYHRLDLGITYKKPKRKGTAIWSFTAYNAYNRQNAYYLYLKEEDGGFKLYQQSIFPIILNFGYTYKF